MKLVWTAPGNNSAIFSRGIDRARPIFSSSGFNSKASAVSACCLRPGVDVRHSVQLQLYNNYSSCFTGVVKINLRRFLIWFGAVSVLICGLRASAAPSVKPSDRVLILVSLDAFRWDYLEKYHPTNLNRLAAEGVHAKKLVPMFPSVTFPNHHTIVTGLRPAHHGIIHNNMYDPATKEIFAFNKTELQGSRWWGGEPIWATAIKQGRRSDCIFWPGTGVTMAGLLPTEWKRYDGKPEPNEVVDFGLAWLDQPSEKRPSFISLYFHHTDSVGHKYGPDSPEIAASVLSVDTAIGRLVDGLHRLKLDEVANLVIVSDHGMVGISPVRTIALGDIVDLKSVQVDFSGAVAGLRPIDGNVEALYQAFKTREKHFKVYRAETMPERYHFLGNPRIPPVIVLADDTWYLSKRTSNETSSREMNKATHGYDPELDSMGATFIAWGPAFRRDVTIEPVENVHVYNLLCATLGLKPAPNDGDDRLAKEVLAKFSVGE
jgi:predicted AlkP superfamily pyrophosphatase or phosphodiesterase